jgi:SEC-C motif-containing protein
MVVVGEGLNCPCGSQGNYLACCGLYIENTCPAPSPETLMRSRYTAYSLAKIDYIKKTMFGKPLNGFNDAVAKHWATSVIWIGLRIINAPTASAEIGYVEFVAQFMEGRQIKSIHERSEFHCRQGMWFYVDGVQKQINTISVARNTLCPCGSHKKFKNCHAKET